MQRKGSRFVADWKDALGRRHRKTFASELDARRFEQCMIAKSKVAVDLGRRIARGVAKGPAGARQMKSLVVECSRIATLAARGKKSATQLSEALSA